MNAKEKLRGRVVVLNQILGRPTSYWQVDGAAQPARAVVGHLSLEYNKDYDNPYQLVETVSESGGERSWGDRMKAGEMSLYLDGIFHGITLQISKQHATTTVWGEEVSVVYKPKAEA
jgi:hypothetical protein